MMDEWAAKVGEGAYFELEQANIKSICKIIKFFEHVETAKPDNNRSGVISLPSTT